jgi:ATP-dependent Clp protease ATP-binding subunit ClpX
MDRGAHEASMGTEEAEGRCSFCHKQRSEVAYLIAAPDGVTICDECVTLSSEILADEFLVQQDRAPKMRRPWWKFWDR